MLFVDYVSSFGMPNRNNRIYNANLIEREIQKIQKIADRFAKQIAINPWAENEVTTVSAVVTAKQPHR